MIWPRALLWAAAVPLWLAWPALQRSVWWYPESGAYQLWVLALVVLILSWRRFGPRGELLWAMSVAGSLSTAGLWALARHAVVDRTAGDLLFGTLRGARRLRRGQPVYDLRGLDQSVNASPLAIVAALPLAGLGDREAIALFLAGAAIMLLLFVLVAKDAARPRDSAESFGWAVIALCLCTTYFSFQRSWRLGQLDTALLALLTLSLSWIRAGRRWRRDGSAIAFGLAAGLKLAPVLAALPLALRAWAPGADAVRRWLLVALITFAMLAAISGSVVGWHEVARFGRNLTLIGRGSTSGNNYALRARIATWADKDARSGHHPLPGGGARWITPLLGLAWIGWTWRFRRASAEMQMALWLAGLPFLSPISWDVYFVWCGILPWWLLWVRHFRRGPDVSPQSRLIWVLASGGYVVGGTMGNTVVTDFHSGMRRHLKLPAFFDEMPLVGHALTTAALFWAVGRESSAASREVEPPPSE